MTKKIIPASHVTLFVLQDATTSLRIRLSRVQAELDVITQRFSTYYSLRLMNAHTRFHELKMRRTGKTNYVLAQGSMILEDEVEGVRLFRIPDMRMSTIERSGTDIVVQWREPEL